MKMVVSAQGDNLDAATSPVFGRCPTFIFVDTETMDFEAVPNEAMNLGGGAGIQAAQFVVNRGVQAVLTGNLGPNAFDVLRAASVTGYLVREGTVRQAVEAFQSGKLQPMAGANVVAHAGMAGAGGSAPRRGMGRGLGMRGGLHPVVPPPGPPAGPRAPELAQLRETLKTLRQQLAETMDRIDELESEG